MSGRRVCESNVYVNILVTRANVAVWRVTGMWGSVVCGGKWECRSVVCFGQCYVEAVVWDI